MSTAKTFTAPPTFYKKFERKDGNQDTTHYCPGCGHGHIHKYIAEALHDFGLQDRAIVISPVGCSVFAYYYLDAGNVQVAHGRSPAVATGLKRANPDAIVVGYQGDGDLAAIGGNEILQAANRGENYTVFFINNAIYGMTGGQMAPTTLLNMKTTTSPRGRGQGEGFPIRVSELLNSLTAPYYIERVALGDNANNRKARAAVRKALQYQVENKGFSLVEILSPCPTGWKMQPVAAAKWTLETMPKVFPLGVFRDGGAGARPPLAPRAGRAGGCPEARRHRGRERRLPARGVRPADPGGARQDRRARRPGRAADRPAAGAGRDARRPPGLLDALLRAGDARRHRLVQRHDRRRRDRLAADPGADGAGRDERPERRALRQGHRRRAAR